jgi:predicted nucleotidyltransferase
MSRKEKILKRIIGVVNNNAPDSELFLFGSRARGTSSRCSDWDLLILLNAEDFSFDFETRIMDDIYEIEIETGAVISPIIYTKKDWMKNHQSSALYDNIMKDGMRLK